jgi:two-component system sensor histidine kinase KdpD
METAPASPQLVKSHDLNWTVIGILGLLILSTLAIVPLTLTVIKIRESDALVIDIAGRQRMLLERHMKEVLLASQGAETDYLRTRTALKERVQALIQGGPVVAHATRGGTVSLPAAPTNEIRQTLLEEQQLMDRLFVKADAFLMASRNAAEAGAARDALLAENAELLEVANDAVILLARHSEDNVQTLIRWEVVGVPLVVLLATLGTWRFLRTEKELKKSQELTVAALRQRDAVKSALLSSVSHELRTPLTAIKTMLYGFQDCADSLPSAVRKEFLTGIDRELDYLNGLVGNLLDMSRLEAGALTPQREWHVMDELVEGAIRRVHVLLAGRPLDIHLAQDLPPIYVDGVLIQQVIVNLLDNAIKFSTPGSPIRIAAMLVTDHLELRISNTGEGVPPEELDRIFERFYRGQPERSSSTPGSGLGLAICKGFVEAHGGQILAESVPGENTTILVRLPLATSKSHRGPVAPEPGAARRAS